MNLVRVCEQVFFTWSSEVFHFQCEMALTYCEDLLNKQRILGEIQATIMWQKRRENENMVNSRLKITLLLVCFLLMGALVTPVLAVEYNPGVSVGQWIKYGDYVLTTPAGSVISPDWSMIEVIRVSGKEVTLRITGAYMNGTAIPSSEVTCNIESGIVGGHQRYIIAANLSQGDKILNLAVSDTINKTETRTILGTNRSVNILNFTSSFPGQNLKIAYIYDQASGMHLGMEMEMTIVEPGVVYTNSYSIIDTNIFEVEPIPEFPSWAILLILLPSVTIFAVFHKRKVQTKKSG